MWTSPRASITLAVALTAAGGCTFEPGRSFATLTPSLRAAYRVPADRDAGDGWQRLSNDYQVRITAARLELGEIALLGAAPGAARTSFDPARPPPGYTLCHNGHCHAADGRLVPYAEIEAELAGQGGGGRGLEAAVTFVVDAPLDLIATEDRALACKPGCELGRTRILRASAPITRLVVEGVARDGLAEKRLPGELRFRWEQRPPAAPATAPVLDAEMDLPADRGHDPDVTLRLAIEPGPALFDGVDFARVSPGDPVDLGGPGNEAAAERLRRNLVENRFMTATVSRK